MCQPGRPGVPMPAGEGQRGIAGLRGFPKHEVHRVFLVGRDVDPRAGLHLLEAAAGELAVVAHGRHVEEYVILGHIGVAVARPAAR